MGEPAPLELRQGRVRPEWLDYNGHMNVAYYVLAFDLWVMLGVTVFFLVWIVRHGTIGRAMGAVFLLAYGAYVASRYLGFTTLSLPQA